MGSQKHDSTYNFVQDNIQLIETQVSHLWNLFDYAIPIVNRQGKIRYSEIFDSIETENFKKIILMCQSGNFYDLYVFLLYDIINKKIVKCIPVQCLSDADYYMISTNANKIPQVEIF